MNLTDSERVFREQYKSRKAKPVKVRCDYCGRPNLSPCHMCQTKRMDETDKQLHPICLSCNTQITVQGRRLKPIPEGEG
jgi:hypothetical protein